MTCSPATSSSAVHRPDHRRRHPRAPRRSKISAVARVPAAASASAEPVPRRRAGVRQPDGGASARRRSDSTPASVSGHAGEDRRPLADLRVRPGVGDPRCPARSTSLADDRPLRALTWGDRHADAPVAVCLHGFPRHRARLAQGGSAAGRRRLAGGGAVHAGWWPRRGPCGSARYHVGALMDEMRCGCWTQRARRDAMSSSATTGGRRRGPGWRRCRTARSTRRRSCRCHRAAYRRGSGVASAGRLPGRRSCGAAGVIMFLPTAVARNARGVALLWRDWGRRG